MKIINKRPVKTADVSSAKDSAFSELWKLIISAVILIIALFFLTGFAVEMIASRISFETEAKIFSYRNIKGPYSTNQGKDSLQMKKAGEILNKMTAYPGVPPLNYRLLLYNDKKPNAFAIPGGTIGLTSGLLDSLEGEIELAFVIGHELGHFYNRDHLQGLGRAVGFSLIMAIIFDSAPGAESFGNIIQHTAERQYSREREEKADQYGVELVYNVYGKIEGTDRLFQILSEKDKIPHWAYMFSTHPSPEKRIKNLGNYIK